jgi:uncharacterized protein YbjT (DUF2867 family)
MLHYFFFALFVVIGVNYCIVRPGGLNDDWPAGSRPILSQGDLAVGRICRQDVATLLVDVLSAEEASGKTFEVIAVADYLPPRNIAPALNRLKLDKDGLPTMQELHITYGIMQQLLPGERQDAAALAMGQTYEQLDKGETGRLGERGKENAEEAAPKPTGK